MRIPALALLALICCATELSAAESSQPSAAAPARRGLFESIFGSAKAGTNSAAALAGLSTAQLSDGVKQALETGLVAAVSRLGRTNGFLTNAQVRIPVPAQLATVETALRRLKQDALVDRFELAMNRAAESAVPEAAAVFVGAVKQISVQDAAALLTSKSPQAITDFFRKNTTNALFQRFLPIVRQATTNSGVTALYGEILEKASLSRFSFFTRAAPNIDEYVTGRAMDGLFKIVAEEEKRIRENPQARTTELLQKVFGAIQSPSAIPDPSR